MSLPMSRSGGIILVYSESTDQEFFSKAVSYFAERGCAASVFDDTTRKG
jgi:hypothetical protein